MNLFQSAADFLCFVLKYKISWKLEVRAIATNYER